MNGMKKMVLLALPAIFAFTTSRAQNAYTHSSTEHYNTVSNVNGFRSVAEENANMLKVLAEKRRKEQDEDNADTKGKPAATTAGHYALQKPAAKTRLPRKK